MSEVDSPGTVTIVVTITPHTESLAVTGADSIAVLVSGGALLLSVGWIVLRAALQESRLRVSLASIK